jgi:protein-tyrosine phosphatase
VSQWFRRFGFADVYDGLVVGAIPLDNEDVRTLDWIGVGQILNLVDDEEYLDGSRPIVTMALNDAGIEEHRIPIADYGSLSDAALEEATTVVNRWLDDGKTVYIHCRAGWQRSAAVAAGVLAIRERVDVDSALGVVQSRRPSAIPLPHQRDDLRRWWSSRRPAESVGGAQVPLAE